MISVVTGFGAEIPSVSELQLGLAWDLGQEYQVFLSYDYGCHGIRGRDTKCFLATTRVVMGFGAGIPSVS